MYCKSLKRAYGVCVEDNEVPLSLLPPADWLELRSDASADTMLAKMLTKKWGGLLR